MLLFLAPYRYGLIMERLRYHISRFAETEFGMRFSSFEDGHGIEVHNQSLQPV
jgi:hypothetical protein